jgi:hypothetical protein
MCIVVTVAVVVSSIGSASLSHRNRRKPHAANSRRQLLLKTYGDIVGK